MFDTFRKSGPLNVALFLLFMPLGIAYIAMSVWCAMEGILNVMMFTMLSAVGSFMCLIVGMVVVMSVKSKFREKYQTTIIMPITGDPLFLETVSHDPTAQASITSTKYNVLEVKKGDYDITTGIVFKAYEPETAETFSLSGLDIRARVDNKIYTNGALQFDEKTFEWRNIPDLDYQDEQKAYMTIMIMSLKNLTQALRGVIMNNSAEMSSIMTKLFSIAEEAYNMIVPVREMINIPIVKSGNTDIERTKAESSSAGKKQLKELQTQMNDVVAKQLEAKS